MILIDDTLDHRPTTTSKQNSPNQDRNESFRFAAQNLSKDKVTPQGCRDSAKMTDSLTANLLAPPDPLGLGSRMIKIKNCLTG